MSSVRADTDPLNLAIATAVDTVASATSFDTSTAAPQIHVHHFHHLSCAHHPDILCTPLPTGTPTAARSEDDYAVVLNSTSIRSPLRPALQPAHNKLSTVVFTAPRKTVCTATIRHPILASLSLHEPRNTHSLDPVAPSGSLFNVSLIGPGCQKLINSTLHPNLGRIKHAPTPASRKIDHAPLPKAGSELSDGLIAYLCFRRCRLCLRALLLPLPPAEGSRKHPRPCNQERTHTDATAQFGTLPNSVVPGAWVVYFSGMVAVEE
ncbi:unnamed protein product [Mesocestoides corti]|uniref:Uncharacterized protein n=1 Tax=Mesocestoides corti TaxID=53468 RepID=A0A0R3UDY5_MESCO|nr:unnamed protein product [Mesocestoides corti]